MKKQLLTKKILNWYDLNKRSLPWRKNVSQTKKQYYTLISEFMLQQTQVATVIPYFNRFIKNIPTIEKLSKYDDRKLIKLWEGLGYYSRVRNLKKTAQIVVKNFNKKIPRNFVDLKSLPGIGDYTASAISAIAFNEPIIPLDGNIERVLKRYLFLKKQDQIKKENLHEKKKIFGTSIKRSSDYAQALMELGALICKPVSPNCNNCPLVKKCKSFKNKNFDSSIAHEATTSKISEEQLHYCQQRGLNAEEAVGLIVNGFCKEVLQQLPMEFAVEAQKLVGISLEGSVG